LGITLIVSFAYSQKIEENEKLRENSVKVFIKCSVCDMDFIRDEIQFVNYVRIQEDADVYILSTAQSTASNGYEYTFYFIGQNHFNGINDTLKLSTNVSESSDNKRVKITNLIKLGLIRYVEKSKISDYLNISLDLPKEKQEIKDVWKQWYFQISSDVYANGEKMYKSTSLWSSISANKITPDWKYEFSVSNSYSGHWYKIDDTTEITSATTRYSFYNLIVKSISEHWSIGENIDAYTSNYSNIKLSASFLPAIEYNIYPFSESNRRQFRFLYGVGVLQNYYIDTTLYMKTKEFLFLQSFKAGYKQIETWGSLSIVSYYSNYLNNFKLNNLSLNLLFTLTVANGLSINLNGGASLVHDQINLPKTGASDDEILTRQRQLESQYTYWVSGGLSFSFGSIYNNIVNPRFDL
jgi:hypothetical protein